MKNSHSHYQTRRNHSMTNKRKNIKLSNISLNDNDNQIKPDTIFNFNNIININSDIEMDESTLGDIEYAKTLQLALKDAINQNDKLTEDLNKCIEENRKLREEIEEKDNVIYELSQYYQFCQNNHINKQINNKNGDCSDNNNNNNVSQKIGSKKKRNQKKGSSKKRNKYMSKPLKEN